MAHIESAGTLPGGHPDAGVEAHWVDLGDDHLRVRLLTLGAAIVDVRAPDARGVAGPVHLRLGGLDEYADPTRNPHLGSSVGRVANRIAGAAFALDGTVHRLVANDGANTLHGGRWGWDRRVWSLEGIEHDGVRQVARMELVSPDGDQGFPGRVEASVTYALEGDTLGITYRATADAPTVLNMTNHGYWNLAGSGTVEEHRLLVVADHVLPVDPAGIPTGDPVPVAGTPFDLRERVRLGPAMARAGGGFDHCYVVAGPAGGLRTAAVLDSPTTGRWLRVRSDLAGVQVYTGNGLGPPFERHGAICLETQALPDAPNRSWAPSVHLDPGSAYLSRTELTFGTGRPPVS